MWLNADVFRQDNARRIMQNEYSTYPAVLDPVSVLGTARLQLRQALGAAWRPYSPAWLTDKPADIPDPSIFLKDVAITTSPGAGLLITLWDERLPGTHWLRIWVPEPRVTTPELWDQCPMQLDEDVNTYGHRAQWQFDPETGGMRFTWV